MPFRYSIDAIIATIFSFTLLTMGFIPSDELLKELRFVSLILAMIASTMAIIWWAIRFYKNFKRRK